MFPYDFYKFSPRIAAVDMKYRQALIDSNRDNLYLEWDIQKINDSTGTYPLAYLPGGDGTTRLKNGGYTVGFKSKPTDNLEIKSEVVYGTNLGDINSLGIGKAQAWTDSEKYQQSKYGYIKTDNLFLSSVLSSSRPVFRSIHELGGWLSFNYRFNQNWEGGAHIAGVKILNPKNLKGASEANLFISQPGNSSWTNTKKMGSIMENLETGYRIAYHPLDNITFFFQNDFKKTIYKNMERYQKISAHIQSFNLSSNEILLRNPGYAFLKSPGSASAISIRSGVIYNF